MILKSKDMHLKEEWELLRESKTNVHKEDDVDHRFEVKLVRKRSEPIEKEMRFIDMCRKAERKCVLGLDSSVYGKLNRLRGLRNRVHIQAVQHDRDNDWWTFDVKDFSLMKEVLEAILTSNLFVEQRDYARLFYWLDPRHGVPRSEVEQGDSADGLTAATDL